MTFNSYQAQAFGGLLLVIGFSGCYASDAVAAGEPAVPGAQTMPDERFAIHGQMAYVEQETDAFTAPYAGPNSLSTDSGRESIDATLIVGARLWPGAEIWVSPEIDQG